MVVINFWISLYEVHMEEDKKVLLFRQIQAATKNGHDSEVLRYK